MTIVFVIIGLALALGVWALYVRLRMLSETVAQEGRANREALEHEFAVLWVAISSEPKGRAEQREEYGLGALHIFDEEMATYFGPQRERYLRLKDELEHLKSRSWDYDGALDRERKTKQLEELRLQVLVESANASAEQKAAWDKISNERLEEELQRLRGKRHKK